MSPSRRGVLLTMVHLFQPLLQAIEIHLAFPTRIQDVPQFVDPAVAFGGGLEGSHRQRRKIVTGPQSFFGFGRGRVMGGFGVGQRPPTGQGEKGRGSGTVHQSRVDQQQDNRAHVMGKAFGSWCNAELR